MRRILAEHYQLIGVDQNVIAACLNHTPIGDTATSYLGGGLAKREMLRIFYQKLQRQHFWYANGMPERRLPEGESLEDLMLPIDDKLRV